VQRARDSAIGLITDNEVPTSTVSAEEARAFLAGEDTCQSTRAGTAPAPAAVASTEKDLEDMAPTVTKIKSFDLARKMSMEEAIFALDYVDHDFFVFRSEESGEINVIYRRHGNRGVGLIQPEEDD